MNKIKHIILALALLPTLSIAEPEDKYFSKKSVTLTQQEKDALAISKRWEARTANGISPVTGGDGTVKYVYGSQQPSVVCAVLQVCDIALQPGEQLNNLHLGDTARWSVEPALTGSGTTEMLHLIVKPLDVGLETTLIATTDRRAYHIKLRSHRTEYMPKVAFIYPEDSQAKFDLIKLREAKERETKTIPQTGEYLGDLSFNYDVDGYAAWKPLRVYNDGRKTIIEMPKEMAQTEAPSLIVVRQDGSDDSVMVNYRVQNNRYIVDYVFDKALLIAGVGNNQDKVTITRRK